MVAGSSLIQITTASEDQFFPTEEHEARGTNQLLWFPTHQVFQHDIGKGINPKVFKPGSKLISTCRALSSVFIGK
jgi:hypothetical protein